MRFLFTCLLFVSVFTARAQAPLTQAFHGCGGAAVVSFPPSGWSNVTYTFQRQDGPSIWTTVLISQSNWHIVLNGELTGPALFRCVQRNNITLEERISNGVTVDPALFPRAIVAPTVTITPLWGLDGDPNSNVLQVIISAMNGFTRPPFRVEYRRQGDIAYQVDNVANSYFIRNITPNVPYEVRVTDYCGNLVTLNTTGPQSIPFATVSGVTCAGGTVDFTMQGSQNLGNRGPFTWALAPLPVGMNPNAVPASFLDGLSFTISGTSVSNVPAGRHVLVARDVFGVRSAYTIVDVGGTSSLVPNIISTGPGTGFCNYFITVANPGPQFGPWQLGYRIKGSGEPYIFSSNLTVSTFRGGNTYEIVLRDNCGILSQTTDLITLLQRPQIVDVSSTVNGCNGTITVNANTCNSNVVYGLVEEGRTDTVWQAGNVFNVPVLQKDYRAYARQEGRPDLTDERSFTSSGLSTFVDARWMGDQDIIQFYFGASNPDIRYQISRDGINFSQPRPLSSVEFPPGVYVVKLLDPCGSSIERTIPAGHHFFVNSVTNVETCSGNDSLGARFDFQLVPLESFGDPITPFTWHVYKWTNNARGNLVKSGSTEDLLLSIGGLQPNQQYEFSIKDALGREFFVGTRLPMEPPVFVSTGGQAGPSASVYVDDTNCSAPIIRVDQFPAGSSVTIYAGRSNAGTVVNQVSLGVTGPLTAGYYTVEVFNDNINGCPWLLREEIYVKGNGPLAGPPSFSTSTAFCVSDPTEVDLYRYWPDAAPNASWSSSSAIVWKDQVRGIFVPKDQVPGNYEFTYTNTNYCEVRTTQTVDIEIGLQWCAVSSSFGDFESALVPGGCGNYSEDEEKQLIIPSNGLVMSIRPGVGNQIQQLCWGSRYVFANQPRTTVIGGQTVYFTDRNYYLEPTTTTIGVNKPRIRLYYFRTDINRFLDFIRAQVNPAITINDLRILKKTVGPGSPVDLDVAASGTPSLYSYIVPTFIPFGPDAWAVEFEVSSFSEFALVFSAAGALPVTWGSVDARLDNGQVLVNWSTLTESNTRDFIVEHSVDGRNFSSIGIVGAAGNSNTRRNYSLRHTQPAHGRNYYRIRQNDKDGKFSYSIVVRVNTMPGIAGMRLMPNPAKDMTALVFDRPSPAGTITLVSVSGQQVWRKALARGSSSVSVDMSGLGAGIYFLRVETEGVTEVLKLMKQ